MRAHFVTEAREDAPGPPMGGNSGVDAAYRTDGPTVPYWIADRNSFIARAAFMAPGSATP
jgi:hypothetical protein